MKERHNSKYQNLVRSIRREIVEGVYGPGHRLPTRVELGAEHGVGAATVQRALNELAEDGFIRARARAGTFVTENPPHLSNYGLIAPAKGQWSRWQQAMHKAAEQMQSDSTVQFHEYFTSTAVALRGDVTELCRDVYRRRLGGLLFIGQASFDDLAGTPALEQEGMPRVRALFEMRSDIPAVYMNVVESFTSRAIEYLTARGRRRIAHVLLIGEYSHLPMVKDVIVKTGTEFQPYWFQAVSIGLMHETLPNVVNMMMHLEGDRRPDALIIHDDNITEHVVTGLLSAGVKVPGDLEIVSHFNYPLLEPSSLPMKRLGFDCRVLLKKSLEIFDMQQKGQKPPAFTAIPAIFEDELKKNESVSLSRAK